MRRPAAPIQDRPLRPAIIATVRVAAAAAMITLAAWSLLDPAFRQGDGCLSSRVCLPLSAATVVGAVGLTAGTAWQACGLWLALAMLGQAASLQMIDAGVRIHYQRYRMPGELWASGGWAALAILSVQTALVGVAWLGRLRRGLEGGPRWMTRLAVLLAIGGGALFAAPVARDVGRFAIELVLAGAIQILNVATICLIPSVIPQTGSGRFLAWLGRRPHSRRRIGRADPVALGGAAWFVAIAAVLAVTSYQRHPHVPDELGYYFQASQLAQGELTSSAPPVPQAFELFLRRTDGPRWYVVTPPGFPAVLALGMSAGVPWLVNPLLGGLTVLLTARFAAVLYGRRTARLVVLMLCTSPWAIFLAMSFMTHTLTLTLALLAGLAVHRSGSSGHAAWAGLAGAAIAAVSLVRPLDAVIVGGLLSLWGLGLGGRRLRLKSLAALVVGAAAVGWVHLPCNAHLTGRPTESPLTRYMNDRFGSNTNKLGFGPDRGSVNWPLDPYPGHGLRDVLVNTDLNLFSLNIELGGWASGSLPLVLAGVFFGRLRRRTDRAMLAAIAAVIGVYSLFWYSGGPDFGPRYWYLMIVPCLLLAARGVTMLARRATAPGAHRTAARGRVALTAALLCVMAAVNYLPWRAIDKYRGYLFMRPDARELAGRGDLRGALILVRGQEHPDYAAATVYNPLDFRGDLPIFAWDRDEHTRQALLNAFPGKRVFLLLGPSLTGGGYELQAPASGPAVSPARKEAHP